MQPPASLVALASVRLQAAPPNAQRVQAQCRTARCLTIQSTGHAPASRVMPVISNVRLQMKVSRTAAFATLLCQKVGPPLVHITSSFASREALSVRRQRGVFGGMPAKARCPTGAHAEAPCMLEAPLGQSVGLPLALKGGNLGSREASVARQLRARYIAFRQAVSRAVACLPPNPSINRTCPGKPGHAGYLQR